MLSINKMNQLEYLIAFSGLHTALSNRFAEQAESEGTMFGARIDGSYAGFLIVTDEVDCSRIVYVLTVPEFRRQGVCRALMQYAADHRDKPGVRLTVSSDHECYEYLRRTCERLGFLPSERVHVFSCSRKDEDRWRTFMEQKGRRLCEMLQMRGYRAVCFRDLDASLQEQLRLSDRSEYRNAFHPAQYLDDPARKLSADLSFAAEKEGRLAAYCLVTMGDASSAMFDQISVSAEELGHGVILLPYVYSMQRFFERDLASAYYAMYESNQHANAFRKKVLKIFPTNESVLENYYYLKPLEVH